MFTTVASYSDPLEAHLACGLLQAEGLDARLDDTGTAIANWEWRLAIGGMRLRVPDAQAIHARRVLAELDAGAYALDTAEDEATDAAEAAADDARLLPPDRESVSSRLAWAALMLLGLPLPWRRRRGAADEVVRKA
ncbi:DUF2007 domain-containing protein [Luteimonas sp. MC1825]|uniref:putative signal transducing protein n=2 Tax=unclassified Luteimonas TaxID=2629088 RepID=UPI001C87AC17|nr:MULTISPECIES: DUF2007 domain-containing protein [unclassified Luteimonas]